MEETLAYTYVLTIEIKQKSYKCDNQLITWWMGINRPAGSWNLVPLKTNFAHIRILFDWDKEQQSKARNSDSKYHQMALIGFDT